MAKVTSKLQVTIPKALAERLGIRPGDDVSWEAAGETLRVAPVREQRAGLDPTSRLRLFDQATRRQKARQGAARRPRTADRGWRREDLYDRGVPR